MSRRISQKCAAGSAEVLYMTIKMEGQRQVSHSGVKGLFQAAR